MIFKIIFMDQPEGRPKDARVHCVVLKVRAVPLTTTPKGKQQEAQRIQTKRLAPQDPTACSRPPASPTVPDPKTVLTGVSCADGMSNVPPMSSQRATFDPI